MRSWKPRVYGTLRRLETQRLVRSRLVPSNQGPARRYYDVTLDGRRALDAWQRVTTTVKSLTRQSKERAG